MRAWHILIAFIMFVLFATVLYSTSITIENIYGVNEFNLTNNTNNVTHIFSEINVLSTTATDVGVLGEKAPGGPDAVTPDPSGTNEGAVAQSGLQVVASVGRLLFTLPKTMINVVGGFFNIDPIFMLTASIIAILVAAIMLVSSILRNQL